MPHVCCDEDVDDEPKGSPVLPLDAVLTRLDDLKFGLWLLKLAMKQSGTLQDVQMSQAVLLWQINRVISECAALQVDVAAQDDGDGDEDDDEGDDADRAEHIKTAHCEPFAVSASAVAEVAP